MTKELEATEHQVEMLSDDLSKCSKALRLALEALKAMQMYAAAEKKGLRICDEAIIAAEEVLAQPEQEPVAWMQTDEAHISLWKDDYHTIPLYTTPPQRTWVGLTPQERDEINEQVYGAVPHHVAFHAAIEAKLKKKNT